MTIRTKTTDKTSAISLVIALALVIASLVGSYSHASGHGHKHSKHGAVLTHASSESGALAIGDEASGDNVAVNEGGDKSGSADTQGHRAGHADCCDFACNGGIAILGAGLSIRPPAVGCEYHPAPGTLPDDRTFGFERPPHLS